ncbi:2-hydroxychromene-2-carboxylate isomerase [Pseudomonas citronellolis]|uniref:2-hydroxychromene-2-carboxylate isomerase n=1 Tax=Pseudomonas citronellolis TaxID=53408 RepID=A0AAQ1KIE0_9PSED|nr:2-hydroxychromene-2-carboxylate isomerase [Pseudomonas citronellolis]MCP1644726.1 2-hydroxychromene-2-carboxylate isomerase [Pseudomonas citronellolis]MCP1665085.1 2-hydroxychromene-2-carboxylate isomerase [Pseudomonas citronellolis]MCP1698880.1 2-hydroxychromene-2-carboxylate isomerase [Pseudomonas citronellolis]MCP1705540.1 2-hydroxychromene-2-carboxylate isomerase [Pseudomonas citronellolis]MCP1799519.1 2-hydroxychromene-2-carboxylate isomerase [Pseudomonas citronellolis]
MSKSVEFYFDFGSPTSYLAYTQLPGICAAAGAELVYRPVLLGGVFQATGNVSPIAVPAKGRYTLIDMQRFARRYGVPLKMNPHFPINTLLLMRAATGVQLRQPERFEALLACVFKGMWVDALNLGDAAVLGPLLAEAGFDPQALLALAADQEVKDALKANTEAAIKRGMFGAPTMFVGEEMFFGQDRLDFVREALA